MRKLASLLFVAPFVVGCGPTASTNMDMMTGPKPDPMPVCTGVLPSSASASFTGDTAACTEVTTALQHHDASDLVTDEYVALGGAVTIDGSDGPFPHGIDVVLPCDLSKGPASAPSSRIVVLAKLPGATAAVAAPVSNIVYEGAYARLHFNTAKLGTFQAAIPKTAGTKFNRHYTWRAIGGVSMGGIGASMNGWRHPDRYDAIAVMGADPGPDLTYTLGVLQDWFFSGFCDVQSGKLGQLCPSPRKPMLDQYEVPMDFEHLIYQSGEGVGLTLSRNTYTRAFRDLSRALGNAGYPSDPASTAPHSTYLPPGVPVARLSMSNADACATQVVLSDYFDYRYNPDGKLPVITFCDGGDGKITGTFDQDSPQTTPTQILLAVDVNMNGKRDSGEPVILQGTEHFYDYGVDGIPDEQEPGYDAVKNPDPNHDDFHWLWNAKGTEKNWRYDDGEKYDDYGVDGVKGKGCAVGSTPPQGVGGCYDYGEGNGKYDRSWSLANWYAHDPRTLLEALPKEQLDRLDVYYDAGIRDFLNAQVGTNSLMGALQAKGQSVRVWEGFPSLTGIKIGDENNFRIEKVDFAAQGRHMYVRYGDPDASQVDVEELGDGRHVGTVTQVIHRGVTMFYFLNRVWPNGDVTLDVDSGPRTISDMFVAKNGRKTNYSVVVPPGYDDPKNATKTYPVFYLGHGYGMKPEDLAQVGIIANNAMLNENVPDASRLQKFIMVFLDGVCRPGGDVRSGPVDVTMGDMCEEGIFYTDHPDGEAKSETQILELQEIIEGKYRVRAPLDVEVVQ